MARAPFSIYKRKGSSPRKFSYVVRPWDEETQRYLTGKSASVLAHELKIPVTVANPKTKAGARIIGQKWMEARPTMALAKEPLLVEYCLHFWDWEKSSYIRDKLDRGQRIGKQYVTNMRKAVELHIAPRAKGLKIGAVTVADLERIQMSIKRETGLGARSVNAALAAVTTALREAHRLGHIRNNPGTGLRQIANDSATKGVLTSEEIEAALGSPWEDPRIEIAFLLGYSCGLRLGEVLALKMDAMGQDSTRAPILWIRASWSVVDGLKGTKTGGVRVVPISERIRDAIKALGEANPWGNGLVLWSYDDADAPISGKFIEGAFNRHLRKIGINEEARKKRHISFHSLRHGFNSALRGAVPDVVLRKATGHATAAMTAHYDHILDENIRDIRAAQERKIVAFRSEKTPPSSDNTHTAEN